MSHISSQPPEGNNVPLRETGASLENGPISKEEHERNLAAWGHAANPSSGMTGYDPNKSYTASTDARGHGEYLRVKFPPETLREVQRLIETGDFPMYTFASDFVRDAVHHWLHHRGEQIGDPEIRERHADYFVRAEILDMTEGIVRASKFWEDQEQSWKAACTQLAKDEAWGQMWHYLRMIEEKVDPGPEPYRTRLLGFIDEWRNRVPREFRSS